MRDRITKLLVVAFCLMGCAWAQTQQPAATDASSSTPTFRAETRLVLVDAVVTDKKGNYIHDLTQKDFKVWEDGKEQPISSFSLEQSDATPNNARRQYMVLFFDNSSMQMGDQAKARDAAAKFIDANAGPSRVMAIVDFGGTIRISQNFTADAERLKEVVKGLKLSTVSPSTQAAGDIAPSAALDQAQADFGAHDLLLALGRVAQGLAAVPGRKTLVLLTSGFPLDFQTSSEVAAIISICNRTNVAVYPIDVRGLTVPGLPLDHSRLQLPADDAQGLLLPAALHYGDGQDGDEQAHLQLASFIEPNGFFTPQRPGGGGGHPAPSPGGGGGSHGPVGGPAGAYNNQNIYNNPNAPRPQIIVPETPHSASDNQQVMYQLADGTGGFVIVNSNDLVGGLQRIANDQGQYYLLGYNPPESNDGSCHTIKVKVERVGLEVRARSGYCNLKPLDALAGSPVEKQLEGHATGAAPGNVTATMQAPFFYTSANIARVDLALDIPSSTLNFEKVRGREHAAINILGIAYKPDGSVGARFSDTADLDFDDKKQVDEFLKQPYHYENEFELASGNYKLTVVFSSGNERFGKIEMPLVIDPYRDKQFSISGVALSNDIRQTSGNSAGFDSELLENKTPLLVQGLEFMPSASNRFKTTDVAAIYAEVYEPLLKDANPPQVAYEMFIRERKTGAEKVHIGEEIKKMQPGNPVVPFGVRLPLDKLGAGDYQVELRAVDSVGNSSTTRVADFQVQ